MGTPPFGRRADRHLRNPIGPRSPQPPRRRLPAELPAAGPGRSATQERDPSHIRPLHLGRGPIAGRLERRRPVPAHDAVRGAALRRRVGVERDGRLLGGGTGDVRVPPPSRSPTALWASRCFHVCICGIARRPTRALRRCRRGELDPPLASRCLQAPPRDRKAGPSRLGQRARRLRSDGGAGGRASGDRHRVDRRASLRAVAGQPTRPWPTGLCRFPRRWPRTGDAHLGGPMGTRSDGRRDVATGGSHIRTLRGWLPISRAGWHCCSYRTSSAAAASSARRHGSRATACPR